MAKVLIVEDDDVIAQGMAHHLAVSGFDPVVVSDGDAGLRRLRFESPDVCVVDLMLPRMDGWRLIESARAEGLGTPIIVVSARGTEHDRVHALEIGADDYLVKPFSMKELVARVGVASRRGGREQAEERGEPIEIEERRRAIRSSRRATAWATSSSRSRNNRLTYRRFSIRWASICRASRSSIAFHSAALHSPKERRTRPLGSSRRSATRRG
jgi:DNA-binding response OmpR family regulator